MGTAPKVSAETISACMCRSIVNLTLVLSIVDRDHSLRKCYHRRNAPRLVSRLPVVWRIAFLTARRRLLVEFRVWLDAARMACLIAAQLCTWICNCAEDRGSLENENSRRDRIHVMGRDVSVSDDRYALTTLGLRTRS